MTAISWAVEADFDRDGSYGTDLTGYVTNPGGTISWQRGLGKDGVYQVSRLGLSLNNSSGIFTVDNSASSLYGKIEPEVPLRVVATFAGAEYAAWTGYIKSWRHGWAAGQVAQCSIEAEDISAYLWQFAPVNVTDAQRTSGAAITAIFAAMGLTASDYDVATGAQTFPHHWVRNTDGMSAAMDVLRCEMGGQLYVDGDGKVVFEGRDGRLGRSQFHRLGQRFGAVLDLRFEERTGTVAYDYSGNGLNGAYQASPTLGATDIISGSGGCAVDFESGSSQYLTVADNAALDLGDTFTVEALIKPESIGSVMAIAAKGNNGFIVLIDASGYVVLAKEGVGNIVQSTVTLAAGTVYHVVVTKTGATVKIYIDGADVTDTVSNATIENTATALHFGRAAASAVYYLDGVARCLRLYGTALSATRVLRLYRSLSGNVWGDDTAIFPVSIAHEIDDADLVSTASVQAQILVDSDPTQVVFGFSRSAETWGGRTADSILIPAGGRYGPFEMDYARPITSLSAPVAGQDYKANSLQNGRGTDLTSDITVTVTDLGGGFRGLIENTGATDAYITKFELQGIPADALVDRPQFTVTRSIAGNKTDLGVTILLSYADDDDRPPQAADYAWALASRYRWPYPRITMDFRPNTDTERAAFLGLELGDLVYYKDTGLGVDQAANVAAGASLRDWYYVESIRMAVPVNYAGQTFDVSATLIPAWLYRDLDRIVYDDFARDNASGDLGTSRSGDAWASDTGFDITSEKARANTDTESIATLDLGALAFDHVAETTLAAIGTGDEVGLAVRYTDANNHYRAYLDKGSNEVILEKVVGGVVTEIASPAYTVGTTAELRVMVQGKRFRVWVGRRLYIDSEDTALNTGTKVGLFARNANATTTFDDFYAEAA